MRPIDADALGFEISLGSVSDETRYLIPQICRGVELMIKNAPTLNVVPVVHCQDCEHCTLLTDGVGFHCEAWDMDLYAPYYDVTTYYCADGKRRDEACT